MTTKSSKKQTPGKHRDSSPFLEAIKKMDEAVKLFYSGNKAGAKAIFEDIAQQSANEKIIADRCRIYIRICNRLLENPNQPIHTPEEFYARGSFRMNQGDLDGAIEDLQSSLKMESKGDHIYYTLAAAYALKKNIEMSAKNLEMAIQLNPENREFVLNDADFQEVFDTPAFEILLETNAQ